MQLRPTTLVALSLALAGAAFWVGRTFDSLPRDLGRLVSTEPTEESLAKILAVSDWTRRGRLLHQFFAERGAEDIPAVKASYDRLRPHLDAVAIAALMDWWARFDAEAALAYGSSFGDVSDTAVTAAVRRWAQMDPLDARRSLDGAQARRWHPKAVLALVRGWADSERPGVWRYVEQLPMGALRQQSIGVLVRHMILHEGPEAAQRYAEALPDGGKNRFKLQVFRQVAESLALQHPGLATAWAERHQDGPFGDSLLFRVALAWVFIDGEGAVSWLAGLPSGDAQRDAMKTAYGFWLRAEPEEARRWLEARAVAPALDAAWAILALELAQEDPPKGLGLLDGIENEALRRDSKIAVGRIWYRADEAAAGEWLANSGLSEDARKRVTAPAPRRSRRVHRRPNP